MSATETSNLADSENLVTDTKLSILIEWILALLFSLNLFKMYNLFFLLYTNPNPLGLIADSLPNFVFAAFARTNLVGNLVRAMVGAVYDICFKYLWVLSK